MTYELKVTLPIEAGALVRARQGDIVTVSGECDLFMILGFMDYDKVQLMNMETKQRVERLATQLKAHTRQKRGPAPSVCPVGYIDTGFVALQEAEKTREIRIGDNFFYNGKSCILEGLVMSDVGKPVLISSQGGAHPLDQCYAP